MNKLQILQSFKSRFNSNGLFKDGSPKKGLLKYNLQLLKNNETSIYLDDTKFYNPNTKRLLKIQYDTRFKQKIIKKSFLKGKTLYKSVIVPKDNNKIEDIVTWEDENTNTTWNEEKVLNNNNLLRRLINDNDISGNYRILIFLKVGKYDDNGNIIDLKKVQVIDNSYYIDNDFWKDYKTDFQVDSDYMVWNNLETYDYIEEAKFIFTKEKQLSYQYYEQEFLDGLNHCFFHPLTTYFNDIIEEAKTEATKKKYQQKINLINGKQLKDKFKDGLIQKYHGGIPEKDIGLVCEKLQIGVIIEQPFGKNYLYEYRSNKKPLKVFRFINTRFNHLEYNHAPLKNDTIFKSFEAETKTKKELEEIRKELTKNNELVIYTNNNFGITSIRTLKNYYKLESDFSKCVKEFEKEFGLNYCEIDSIKYPYLQEFINFSTHYNSCIDLKDTSKFVINNKNVIPDNINHIDMTKAYTQFYKSKYYCQFMGKITDFRKVNNHDINGLYYINNLDISKCNDKFKKLNKILNWFNNDNSYTKAELDMLKDKGGLFNVVLGAFGLDLDFRFNEDMINKKEIIKLDDEELRIPYYSKWTGAISTDNHYKSIYMNGKKEFFNNIDITDDTTIFYNEDMKEAKITFQKKYSYNKKHITSQITAYQRLIMLEQLEEMDLEKIYRICVDGIYYEKHDFKINETFGDKTEKMTFRNSPSNDYLSNLNLDNGYDIDFINHVGEERQFYKKELFIGAGGNGKSFYNLNDKGLINSVFVCHSWKLTTNQQKEYFEKYGKFLYGSVHHRVFNNEIDLELNDKFNNYIIDEVSMLTEGQKKFIFENVKGKIIMLGDINYQLPPIEKEKEMTIDGFDNVIELKKNYRFKCDKLKNIIKYIRNCINKKNKVNKNLLGIKKINEEELKKIYNKDDLILVSRHIHNDNLNKLLGVNKYKVIENTRDYKNGEIIFNEIKGVKTELRNGYTIHSIQGETHKTKLFIYMKNITCDRMLYTAISRAEYIDNIYFVY